MTLSYQHRVLCEMLKFQPPKWWADELGVHVSEISRWKSGQRGMSLDQVVVAHRILEVEGLGESEAARRAERVAGIIAEAIGHRLEPAPVAGESSVTASMHGVLAETSELLTAITSAMAPDSAGGFAITEEEAARVEPELLDVKEKVEQVLAQLGSLRRPRVVGR